MSKLKRALAAVAATTGFTAGAIALAPPAAADSVYDCGVYGWIAGAYTPAGGGTFAFDADLTGFWATDQPDVIGTVGWTPGLGPTTVYVAGSVIGGFITYTGSTGLAAPLAYPAVVQLPFPAGSGYTLVTCEKVA